MKNKQILQWKGKASGLRVLIQRLGFGPALPLLVILCLSPLFAAPDDTAEKPSPPFLADIREPISITREFKGTTETSKKLPAGSQQTLLLKSVTEIRDSVRRVLQFFSGRQEPAEFWVAQGVMLGEHPSAPGSLYFDEGAASGSGSDLVSIFPEAKWVDLKNFVKWDKVDGQLCRVHAATLPPTLSVYGEVNANILSGPVTVWIDDATRRPLKVQSSLDVTVFTYGPGPSSPLVIPPKIAQTLQSIHYGPGGQMR